MSRIITVTSTRSNAYVRKGRTAEVEWTPRVQQLIDLGILSPLAERGTPDFIPVLPVSVTREELVEQARELGITVSKGRTKAWIAQAIDEALSAPPAPVEDEEAPEDPEAEIEPQEPRQDVSDVLEIDLTDEDDTDPADEGPRT